ncbi:MAG: hypothetical protein QNJ98_07355 [Planctomycetota bacterium]|nr:hypothetical protein [Planctomycetota bacterium]
MAESPSEQHPALERSSFRTREVRTGLSAKARLRRGRFHIALGVFAMAFFPTVALIEPTGDRFTWIAGTIVMVLVGMQQISRGIDELKLAKRRGDYEQSQRLIDEKVFD